MSLALSFFMDSCDSKESNRFAAVKYIDFIFKFTFGT